MDYGLCWRQAGDCSKKLHFHPLTSSRLGKTFELTIPATCERDRGLAVPATCTWTCSCVFVQRFSQNPVETVIQCCDWLVPQRSVESRSPTTGMTNLLCLHDGVKFIICNSSLSCVTLRLSDLCSHPSVLTLHRLRVRKLQLISSKSAALERDWPGRK